MNIMLDETITLDERIIIYIKSNGIPYNRELEKILYKDFGKFWW